MIDLFSLGLTHAIMLLALWRLSTRPEHDGDAPTRRAWGARAETPGDA